MLRFVEHRGGELELFQFFDVTSKQRVTRDDDVDRRDRREERGAVWSFEHKRFQFRRKLLRLALPIRDQRGRADNQARAGALMRAQKCECLHGFTEAHLIREDAAEVICGQSRKPGKAGDLVFA